MEQQETMELANKKLNSNKKKPNTQFINSNTSEISLEHLSKDCIIPTFKDNEQTLAHQELIEATKNCIASLFPSQEISQPEIMVSHEIKGRIPEAIGKPVKELQTHEKTRYYERCAFLFQLPNVKEVINNNELSLTIGGVRAYNMENLYSKKSMEKFKVFIGFQNKVCTNLCISTDGFQAELRASNISELEEKIIELIQGYDAKSHLVQLDSFGDYSLTESQFAHFIGRAKLYHYLPKKLKAEIPLLDMNDGHISSIARTYFEDENFSSEGNGNIDLWKMYNLFTGATKSSYIDTFLDRTVSAHKLTRGITHALDGHGDYQWFLS